MAADFAGRRKAQYLHDVEVGQGRKWSVVLGNEAGDLDSVASALGYAWIESEIRATPIVAMVQTLRSDLHLRAENSYALSISGFDPTMREILCTDDLPESPSFPSNKFVLVDHNRLATRFSKDNPDAKVVAIVDHHEDEGSYKDTADPRIIVVPTGSCASLIASHIQMKCPDELEIPSDLATLLLCSIIIDTSGLKPGGRAQKADIEAAAYLLPRSTLASSLSPAFSPINKSKLHEIPALAELTSTLKSKRTSVSHLGIRDLLRRDYKEYSLVPSWDPSSPIQLGLASVPLGLKSWIPKSPNFRSSIEEWMVERNLAALGILTSFRSEKKGKHKRELLMVVNADAAKGELAPRILAGLAESKGLRLAEIEKLGVNLEEGFRHAVKAKAYAQGNVDATRKFTAPLFKTIIEE